MEATGPYYLRLASWLYQNGFKVSVINPLVIRRFCQMKLIRAKTDKADARMIALYGKTEKPAAWEPHANYIMKLQQLDSLTDLLIKTRTALQNQLHAFQATGLIDTFSRSLLKQEIRHITRKLEKIELQVIALVEQHHKEMLENLTSIPGIGRKTAVALITISAGFKRFNHHKQLSAYIGITPRIYESGTSVKGRASICKLGMSRIRASLYVCAWAARKCNEACKLLYERLVAKGKAKNLALIAVANKLVKQAFAIATNGSRYQPGYNKNICL